MTFDGRRSLTEDTFDQRRPLMEDYLDGRQPLTEDDLRRKITFEGRRQSCKKPVSWYLGYRTFFGENSDIFDKLLVILAYLALKG